MRTGDADDGFHDGVNWMLGIVDLDWKSPLSYSSINLDYLTSSSFPFPNPKLNSLLPT